MCPTEGAFECRGSVDHVYSLLSDEPHILESSGRVVPLGFPRER